MDEKRLWEKLQDANRRDIFGWTSAAMVHEIRNPLTALNTLIQLLPQKRDDDHFIDSFQKLMKREISRLSELTNGLLDLSNFGSEKMAMVDLREILQQVAQLMGPLFNSKNIQLKVKAPKSFFLRGDKTQIECLFINLLQNGLKAVGPGGPCRGFNPAVGPTVLWAGLGQNRSKGQWKGHLQGGYR